MERFATDSINFSCVLSGIKLGEIKNKDFIPSAQLALSEELDFEYSRKS